MCLKMHHLLIFKLIVSEVFFHYLLFRMLFIFSLQKRALLEREYNKLITTCNELRSSPAQSDLGDGDFKRAKSWRKKFKKERTSLKRKEDSQRKHSGESDLQTASSGSGEITSPLRRPRKSPLNGMDMSRLFGDHSFSTYVKFSEKLTFLTPSYAHVHVHIRG